MTESEHVQHTVNDKVKRNTAHYVGNASVQPKHGILVCVHLSSVQNVPEYLYIFYSYSVSLGPRPFLKTQNLTPKQATAANKNLLLTERNLEQTYVVGCITLPGKLGGE